MFFLANKELYLLIKTNLPFWRYVSSLSLHIPCNGLTPTKPQPEKVYSKSINHNDNIKLENLSKCLSIFLHNIFFKHNLEESTYKRTWSWERAEEEDFNAGESSELTCLGFALI